jgi:hypothetical protein
MTPFLASMLEQLSESPGSCDGIMVSCAASDAAAHIRRLEDALTGIMRGAPEGSHAKLTAAAALDMIGADGLIKSKEGQSDA